MKLADMNKATAIIRDAVRKKQGILITELQSRSLLAILITITLGTIENS